MTRCLILSAAIVSILFGSFAPILVPDAVVAAQPANPKHKGSGR